MKNVTNTKNNLETGYKQRKLLIPMSIQRQRSSFVFFLFKKVKNSSNCVDSIDYLFQFQMQMQNVTKIFERK